MADGDIAPAPLDNGQRRVVGGVTVDIVPVGAARIKRVTYPPGYRWSTHLRPQVGGERCRHTHVGFMVQGTMQVEYADGCRSEFVAPAVVEVLAGHDAWVVGDTAAVVIETEWQMETAAQFGLPPDHRHP